MTSFRTRSRRRSRPGQPPDFAFGFDLVRYMREMGLRRSARGPHRTPSATSRTCSIRMRSPGDVRSTQKTGQKALYGLPMGRTTNHVHVWKSLLEQAGFTLEDIPQRVGGVLVVLVRRSAAGACAGPRAATTSGASASPCRARPPTPTFQFLQFLDAYEADYVTRDGQLVIDDPEIRRRLIKAIDSYTAVYRKGCTPPDSVTWDDRGNNEQFLAQAVVMTPNETLSIPNALKRERPEDYYENTRHDRMAARPGRRALSDPWACSLPPWSSRTAQRRDRQGVRPLPRGRGLARALSRLRRRAHAAADAEAARRAVLARSERPAPHGRGDAGRVATARTTTTPWSRATGGTTWSGRRTSGRKASTASPPRASAPSRRSTRRSPGSSRSWRSERSACLDVSVATKAGRQVCRAGLGASATVSGRGGDGAGSGAARP